MLRSSRRSVELVTPYEVAHTSDEVCGDPLGLGRPTGVKRRSSKDIQGENETHLGARDGVDDTRATEFVNDVVVAPLHDEHWIDQQAVQHGLGLDTWFKRPIKLFEGDWVEGLGLFLWFDPWRLWINDASVRNKLGGYGLFRGNLNLKFVINASPYQYAQLILSYKPLASTVTPAIAATLGTDTEMVDFSGGCMSSRSDVDIAADARLMKRTTRWHTKMNVQDSQGMEMALPYIHYEQWLRIDGNPVGPYTPGRCTLASTGVLRSCSGSAGSAVEFTLYAWMDNFEVTRATFVSQAYVPTPNHPGVMPGSSTGTLGRVPTLSGLLRTGVHMMADSAMTALGLTKHSVLREPTPVTQLDGAHLAVTDMNIPGNVLAMSSGNSVTIDPSVMQPDSQDHCAFAHIMAKAPIVQRLDWNQTARGGTVLATAWVSPEYGFVSSALGFNGFPYNSVEHGPHSHVASCFKYWRGPITFHFEVVKTQFHKGRLAIIYEPNPEVAGVSNDTRLQVTKIIDISEVSELDFEVDFMATRQWLEVSNWLHSPVAGTVSLSSTTSTLVDIGSRVGIPNPRLFNGSIRVVVINALTSPVANAPVTVQMRVSCPRVEFAEPVDPTVTTNPDHASLSPDIWYTSTFTAQPYVNNSGTKVEADYRITMGEQVTSARALMQRTTRLFSRTLDSSAQRTFMNWPLYPLVNRITDNQGSPEAYPPMTPMCTANVPPSAVVLNANLVRFNYINWFKSCFVGARGGIEYRVVMHDGENPLGRVEVARRRGVVPSVFSVQNTAPLLLDTAVNTACTGVVVKTRDSNSCVVKVPAYAETLFAPGNPLLANDALSPDGVTVETWNGSGSLPVVAELWANAADDFSLGWYVCPPTYFLTYQKPVCVSA